MHVLRECSYSTQNCLGLGEESEATCTGQNGQADTETRQTAVEEVIGFTSLQ